MLTDAPLSGGGCVWETDWMYVNWAFDYPALCSLHINYKETFTIILAAHRWAPFWQQLDREVIHFRCQAYAPTTKATYMSQMRSYLSSCVSYGYQPIPASVSTLNRYAAFLARSLSASSIPAYLNAARILHLEHGLADPTKNNFQLATILQEIKRIKGLSVSQKKPITPQILLAFKNHLNLDDPLHVTFWAVCLVAFFGLLRKANLLCRGLTHFNPSKHLR